MTELRCRPNDQAWILPLPLTNRRDVSYFFWTEVTVKWSAYPPEVIDPAGGRHGVHASVPCWLVEFKEPVKIPTTNKGWRDSRYAVIADRLLLPIRPNPDPEEDHYTEGAPCQTTR